MAKVSVIDCAIRDLQEQVLAVEQKVADLQRLVGRVLDVCQLKPVPELSDSEKEILAMLRNQQDEAIAEVMANQKVAPTVMVKEF